ncbi:hypothetical protein BMF94_5562 [Rhodotorula taiwanensis]|uniref:F-box domain-containing protein n=1 Tax=Rhodotorula taiwanensis TaxID=741276 RepID=A0A2S5B3A4_9BASI|nr:hypothetical protein BMF94_5562 [Rhodotorula taiwanensis]
MTAEALAQTRTDDSTALADGLERLHVASAAAPPCARVAASSAGATEASATFALPVELVIRVLELAVAADRSAERAILLIAPANVSKAWRYAARVAFWRHVTLEGVRPSKWDQRFADSILCEPGLLRTTQTIHFGSGLRSSSGVDQTSADAEALAHFRDEPVADAIACEDRDSAFRQLLCAWSYLIASVYERRMMFRTLGEPDPGAATRNYTLKAIEVDLASMHSSNLVQFLQGLQAFASLRTLTVNLHPTRYYWADEDAPLSSIPDPGLAVSRLNLVMLPNAIIDSLPRFINLCSLILPSERTEAYTELLRSLITALPNLRALRQLLLIPQARRLSPDDGHTAGVDYRTFLAALPLSLTHCSVRDVVFDSPSDRQALQETFGLQTGHAVVRLFARDESISRLLLRIFTRAPRSVEWRELRHRAFPSKGCAPKHERIPKPRRTQALGIEALTKTPAASIPSAPLSFAQATQAKSEANAADEEVLAGGSESVIDGVTSAVDDAPGEPTPSTPQAPVTPRAAAAPTPARRECCILS